MDVQRLAAFTYGDRGGNPAGVVLCDTLPESARMQAIAAEIGYSETVFAARTPHGYRVRYFAPKAEIPFCGHATIALGAALAAKEGDGTFELELNEGRVYVEGRCSVDGLCAALVSPPTRNSPPPDGLIKAALTLFTLADVDLDPRIPPAIIEAGARHLLLALRDRQTLAAMRYEMKAGAELMRAWGFATISLVYAETFDRIHARNPFAAGGVYEDPATGAAAAALVGYLQVLDIEAENVEIVQGEDMGVPCLLRVTAPALLGGGARVQGEVRHIKEAA
ncbi:PhzF family phenazine biosynthesis protein [Novosphingobium capsulatum]|uniref:PhzF family phenazine biosynthesis protein n=1 Tax=Novosphingobium capsulatum TaxID=13688 RepID=UPI000788DF83|nr:PhzF family phenazine biosynthesis protein [Novosphingobium capsulatum]WQD91394.1 PhzF family phenazine biosynthesis protein [Novosphingobium capsulatum]